MIRTCSDALTLRETNRVNKFARLFPFILFSLLFDPGLLTAITDDFAFPIDPQVNEQLLSIDWAKFAPPHDDF